MTGRRFRPTLGASLAAFAALVVLLGLGIWQLQRLHWKEALIAERRARLTAPAIALPEALDRVDDVEFRRVRVGGRFDHAGERHLGARTYKGQVGFHVVTPLALADGGRVVLVDRGWVPPRLRAPGARAEGQVKAPVAFEAVVRSGGWQGSELFRPENDPAANYWLWVDTAAMLAASGAAKPVTGVYLQAVEPTGPGDWPEPVVPAADLRNDHLEYAVTWFALAGVLVAIYLLMHLRPPEE